MDPPEGAGSGGCNRVDFDHRVGLEFRGTQISSDGGLPVIRELDDVPGLSGLASVALRDSRQGKTTVHRLDGLFRQPVHERPADSGDVNDAARLVLDPVMRQVVGGARSRHRRPPPRGWGGLGPGRGLFPETGPRWPI